MNLKYRRRLRFKVRGKLWNMIFCPHKQVQKLYPPKVRKVGGILFGQTQYGEKLCIVSDDLNPQLKLDTTIHEALHAELPDLCEETVSEVSTELAELLWEVGYRKVEQ